jgi:hypothetical protein
MSLPQTQIIGHLDFGNSVAGFELDPVFIQTPIGAIDPQTDRFFSEHRSHNLRMMGEVISNIATIIRSSDGDVIDNAMSGFEINPSDHFRDVRVNADDFSPEGWHVDNAPEFEVIQVNSRRRKRPTTDYVNYYGVVLGPEDSSTYFKVDEPHLKKAIDSGMVLTDEGVVRAPTGAVVRFTNHTRHRAHFDYDFDPDNPRTVFIAREVGDGRLPRFTFSEETKFYLLT